MGRNNPTHQSQLLVSSPRHSPTCTPFRLHSTYTRPPYPGATPSPPPSLHHLRTFTSRLPAPMREPLRHLTACAHSRCLRSYTSPANKLCLNLCAHPRCLRSFAIHYNHLTAYAHSRCLRSYTPLATKKSGHFFAWSLSLDSGDLHWTHSFIICHGGFDMPGVIHLTGN